MKTINEQLSISALKGYSIDILLGLFLVILVAALLLWASDVRGGQAATPINQMDAVNSQVYSPDIIPNSKKAAVETANLLLLLSRPVHQVYLPLVGK